MGGEAIVEPLEHVPVDLHVSDIGEVVVRLLDGLEVDDPDIPLHNGPEQGVLDLLRPLVAVVGVAVLDVIPHGEDADGVVVRGLGDGVHAGLHDVFPLDIGFDQANGDAVVLDVFLGKLAAAVIADDGLAAGDDIGGGDAVFFIAGDDGFGIALVVVPAVAHCAGDHLQPQGLDGLHLLRHQPEGEVHQLGGDDLVALGKAFFKGVDIAEGGHIEGVVDGTVQQQVGLVALPQDDGLLRVEPLFHGVHHKVRRVPARGLHQHVEAVIAELLDAADKGGGIACPPVRVLDHRIHHGGGHIHGGVLHQGGEALLLEADPGDPHVPELLQPPDDVLVALLGQKLQLVVVQDHVIGLVFRLHAHALEDDAQSDQHGGGQKGQEDTVGFDEISHALSAPIWKS